MEEQVDYVTVMRVRQLFREGTAREMREATGLSLREFAALAKLNRSSLQQWETGSHMPRPVSAMRWAHGMRLLGVDV